MKPLHLALMAVCVLFVGCTTDISGDSHYQTGFRPERIYRLRQDVLGIVVRDSPFHRVNYIILLAPKDKDRVANHGEELVAIPKDTRIFVAHVLLTHDVENGTQMSLLARFDSGPYKGTPAKLDWISTVKKLEGGGIFSHLTIRDENFLEEEGSPNKAAEPTRTSGTPPADAGDRASGARGSL
jgi:hypothetical protein